MLVPGSGDTHFDCFLICVPCTADDINSSNSGTGHLAVLGKQMVVELPGVELSQSFSMSTLMVSQLLGVGIITLYWN